MNSIERIRIASKGGRPDCVPVAPYIGNYGAALSKIPIPLYNHDARKMAFAQFEAWKRLQLDVVVPQSDNYYIAEGMGTVTDSLPNETPYVVRNAIANLSEVSCLTIPDPQKDGRMPVYLEAVSILRGKLSGQHVAIRSGGTGPFSLACHLIGTEKLLLEIAICESEEDSIREQQIMQLMKISTLALTSFSTALLDAGADFVVCGDSAASPDLIPPKYYEKYVFPFEKQYFDVINSRCLEKNAVSLLHICGNTSAISSLMVQTGANILEVDHKVDLAAMRKIVGPSVCIMGNIDPCEILLMGNPEIVSRHAEECIRAAGRDGAFILGSGCEVCVGTPVEHIDTMRDVARAYRYWK